MFALSNLTSLAGHPDSDHLLILSQEVGKIVEVDRDGNIYSALTLVTDPGNPLSIVAQQHEGMTMDDDGFLYVVSENGGGDFDHPQLWVFAPFVGAERGAHGDRAQQPGRRRIDENTHHHVADQGGGRLGHAMTDWGRTLSASPARTQIYFEVDSTGLYIKAGTVLDFETKTQLRGHRQCR